LRTVVKQWESESPRSPTGFAAAFSYVLVATFVFNLLVYWAIVSVTLAISYYSKYQDREIRGIELERRLTEARLQALQMQLNPHFLFNTLHAIFEHAIRGLHVLVHKRGNGVERVEEEVRVQLHLQRLQPRFG